MNPSFTHRIATVLLLAGCLLPTGCTVCQWAKIVSVVEPKIYSWKEDKRASIALYSAMADEAWAETGACVPNGCVEADYAWGFREGFADYVYAGGDGQPPAVAPRAYWQVDMRTPEGAMIVRSWFDGYRHGAKVAIDGGYRKTATVVASASVRDCTPCGCPEGAKTETCDCGPSGMAPGLPLSKPQGPPSLQAPLTEQDTPQPALQGDQPNLPEIIPPRSPDLNPPPTPLPSPEEADIPGDITDQLLKAPTSLGFPHAVSRDDAPQRRGSRTLFMPVAR